MESNFEFSDGSIFVDAGNHDYHLAAAHPSITDMGMNLQDDGVDADCHDRLDGMPDIGADEFESISTSTYSSMEDVPFQVFPNPNMGSFFIESSKPLQVELWDGAGKIIWRADVSPENQQAFSMAIPAGMYLLKWQSDQGTGVEKIMVTD